jgi:hypothetical protein
VIHASFAHTILALCAEVRWLACGNILISKDENGNFFWTITSAIDNNVVTESGFYFDVTIRMSLRNGMTSVSLFKVMILIS